MTEPSVLPVPPMYNWQKKALAIWQQLHLTDETSMTVAAVTGSGKTRLALEIMEDWLKYSEIPEWDFVDLVTIVVPTKALMIQWRDCFIEWGIPGNLIGRIGGGSIKGWANKPAPCYNIVSLQTLAKGKPDYMSAFDERTNHLVIVDECHNLRGKKMREALSVENCPRSAVLGLSATPHPTPEAKKVIESLCGPMGYSYRYGQALADGVIPPFVINAIQIPLNAIETNNIDYITRQIKNVMKEASYESGAEAQRLYSIAKALGTKRKRALNQCKSRFHVAMRILATHGADTPTLLFHESIDDIERLAQMTDYLKPALYHSKGKGVAELERFALGETNHLYSCLALTEGFNVPRVQVAIMMSGPNAPLRRIQTLGRCLRGNTDTVNEIYFLYVPNTKDEEGLYNLLNTGDIPQMVKIGDKEIKVVKHYQSTPAGLIPIPPPTPPQVFVATSNDTVA